MNEIAARDIAESIFTVMPYSHALMETLFKPIEKTIPRSKRGMARLS